jgi:hypothetical protein
MTSVKKIIGWSHTPESCVWDNFNTGYDAPVGLVGAVYDSSLDSIPAYNGAAEVEGKTTRGLEFPNPARRQTITPRGACSAESCSPAASIRFRKPNRD